MQLERGNCLRDTVAAATASKRDSIYRFQCWLFKLGCEANGAGSLTASYEK